MRALVFLAPLLLTGCFRVVNNPTCEEVDRYEVADDEVTPAGTAEELIAMVALDTDLPGTWFDGRDATAQVLVQPDGPAEWVEQQSITEKNRSFGFGSFTPAIYVVCPNQLELPLVADVASLDGSLGVAASGNAYLPDPDGESFYGPGVPIVDLKGDFASSTFPPSEEDPDAWNDKYTFVNLDYDEVGFLEGSAGWGGSQQTDEVSSSMAEYVLRFAPEPTTEPSPTE